MTSKLHQLKAGHVDRLKETLHLGASAHQWSQPEIDALILAQAAQRPLLVQGEPGTGKTQLARAAAQKLGWALLSETIHPRYEAQDLMWRFDAVRRLSDAQAGKDVEEVKHYYQPGPLWLAYDWDTACTYGARPAGIEPSPEQSTKPLGHVILIDEIDKADSDLPNSLLEVLGQRSFSIGPLNNLQVGGPHAPKPLVLITTNEERELPPAFKRRCVVLNLALPAAMSYRDWLVQRGLAHHGADHGHLPDRLIDKQVLQATADQLVADRDQAVAGSLPPPGPAEYLDLLAALLAVAPADTAGQLNWLERLSAYAFIKNAWDAALPDTLRQDRATQAKLAAELAARRE